MTITYIAIAAILFIMIPVIFEECRTRFCRKCGTRMNRYYDQDEDAEFYQCPKCGRSYLIK